MKEGMRDKNVGFVGPFGSANLGDYGILINDIFDLGCSHITVFSYNYNWPKVQLDDYCKDCIVDYCHVQLKKNHKLSGKISEYTDNDIIDSCVNIDEVETCLKSIDVLIISGGGWINDFWADRTEKISKIAIVIVLAKRYNLQIRFATQGLGPLGEYEDWYRRLFDGVNATMNVRDVPSIKIGNDRLGLTTKLCPDDLLIQNKKWESFESEFEIPKASYVAVEPFVSMDELCRNKEKIKEFAQKIKDRYGLLVVYMPFDLVHFGNEQAGFCSTLDGSSVFYDISPYLYPKFQDVSSIIRGAQLVISARYHGLVLALSHKVPVLHVVNDSHGDYGQIKATSVLQRCFSSGINEGLFCEKSLFGAFDRVGNDFYEISKTQESLYNSDVYANCMKSAIAEHEIMIKTML